MEQEQDAVKMIIGDKIVEMAAGTMSFNRLTTTGEFVLQTADGEDLVASCISFVASASSDHEPTKQFLKLNTEWKDLPVDDTALVVFFRH